MTTVPTRTVAPTARGPVSTALLEILTGPEDTSASAYEALSDAAATALNATATALAARTDLTARHQAAVAVDAAWNGLALVGERHRDTAEHRDLVRAVHACELLLTPGAPEITRQISDAHELAQALRIDGTPAFIVGDKVIHGADVEALRAAVAAARRGA